MSDPDPTATTAQPAARRALTADELDRIHAAITTAENTHTLINAAITALFDALLADSGQTLADFGPDRLLDPGNFAIPRTQWTAILTAATHRATEWGAAATVGLDLSPRLPDPYDDPDTPDPGWPRPAYRPTTLDLRLDSDATDVIAAALSHLAALAVHYGPASARHLDALGSWTTALGAMLQADLGNPVHIHRYGPLSLLIEAPGLIYAVVFHGQPRTCTLPGCGIRLPDQPTTGPNNTSSDPDSGGGNREGEGRCEHRPSYPYGAPQPGSWTTHS